MGRSQPCSHNQSNTTSETKSPRYPIGLRSTGAFTILGRSTIGDGLDRPQNQRQLSQITQVGGGIAKTIATQADWDMLRRFGFSSQIHSWPKAVERVGGTLPDETIDPANSAKPRTLDTLADYAENPDLNTPENISIRWQRDLKGPDDSTYFGSNAASGATVQSDENALSGTVDETFPDGIKVNGDLAWRVDGGGNSPIQRRGNELNGFQWSMWVKPETTPSDGTTLMEMRSPTAHVWNQLDGTAGTNDNKIFTAFIGMHGDMSS